jgi:PrgI family protein
MQFSVPQFTDVEDRIVAGLSIKQFGIIFGAGVLVFVFYTITKSLAAVIVVAVLVGIPALIVAFAKVNGRPIYSSFGNFVSFFTSSQVYVFRKQAKSLPAEHMDTVEVHEEKPAAPGAEATVVRMKQLNYLLQQQASEEQVLLDRIAEAAQRNRSN